MSTDNSVSTGPVPIVVQELLLDRIEESKANPRRTFDETKLRELAEDQCGENRSRS
ncbi:MAG: hypothetical protein L0Z53_12000 [Acidobacteriales bacterium]|nr:hypothetical protein [Terriglobales bacterium]MCI0625412.1 hypothetical protein [Acidobacteriota bacterium]